MARVNLLLRLPANARTACVDPLCWPSCLPSAQRWGPGRSRRCSRQTLELRRSSRVVATTRQLGAPLRPSGATTGGRGCLACPGRAGLQCSPFHEPALAVSQIRARRLVSPPLDGAFAFARNVGYPIRWRRRCDRPSRGPRSSSRTPSSCDHGSVRSRDRATGGIVQRRDRAMGELAQRRDRAMGELAQRRDRAAGGIAQWASSRSRRDHTTGELA